MVFMGRICKGGEIMKETTKNEFQLWSTIDPDTAKLVRELI